MREYWIVEDIWREIKLYLFHNIKIHGKHLKKDKNVIQFKDKTKDEIRKHYYHNIPTLEFNFQ